MFALTVRLPTVPVTNGAPVPMESTPLVEPSVPPVLTCTVPSLIAVPPV